MVPKIQAYKDVAMMPQIGLKRYTKNRQVPFYSRPLLYIVLSILAKLRILSYKEFVSCKFLFKSKYGKKNEKNIISYNNSRLIRCRSC